MKKLLFLLVIVFFPGLTNPEAAQAQTPSALRPKPSALSSPRTELGKPLLNAWLPKDYDAETQNWAIVQDDRGVMYFGNSGGVLEFDGASWRLIQFPNKSTCRSLAKDVTGRIYAGGKGDFGYLAPDSVGQMRLVSLLPQVPKDARDFTDVWQAYALQKNVYFTTFNYVFLWTPFESSPPGTEMAGEMKVWKSGNTFHASFVVDGIFYVREWEKGLLRMQGDSLQLVPDGEQFANERIYVMLPFADDVIASEAKQSPDSVHHNRGLLRAAEKRGTRNDGKGRILIGTRTKGLFLYDGQAFHPFKTEADEFLQQNPLYLPGAVLSDGRLLLNTVGSGAVLLDRNGRLLQTIDRSSGLPDNA